ncbi:MAG: nucleotidyltransferase family protein [Candidatus Aenigmarchaeota archaeon]|nr:nucleotidyltransferase family protein [Candidatus Aenigmarchaeota archaeon]
MKAVILCGGLGTRLRPITYEIPKVLIPVQGKPVLEHLIDLLKREGVDDIVLSVGHLRDRIRAHCGNGSRLGVRISYLEEASPLGTGGPLRLLDPPREPFIVSNGDELKDIDLREMLALHQQTNALATIALTQVENPTVYGVARLEGQLIREFVEKPLHPPSNLANAGLYILDPAVIDLVPNGFAMLEKDVFPQIARQGRLAGYPFTGQWFDTGSFERYERAIREWRGLSALDAQKPAHFST